MRIHDQNLTGAAASQTGGAPEIQQTGRGGDSRVHGAAGDGDRVELSSTLGALSRALELDRSDRSARVQHLAAVYQRGEYRPDLAAAAKSMIAEALGGAAG
jgi:hypothetical protein